MSSQIGKEMGFAFHGFFALAGQDVLEQALRHWPCLRGRIISEPFHGIGAALPDVNALYDTEEEYWKAQEDIAHIEQELPEWSCNCPGIAFVYIAADCFGGVCHYQGYVCQDGRVIVREVGEAALEQLVGYLGIKLDRRRYFAPFTRDFFDRSDHR